MTLLHRAAALVAMAGLHVGPAFAQTGDPAPGAQQAGSNLTQTCRVCHGLDGVGTNPIIPNIGGQSPEYLSKALQDYRAGRREDPQMSIIASDLSDDDIRDLVAWYASITATYEMPK